MGETPKTTDWLERMMKQVAEIAAEKHRRQHKRKNMTEGTEM